MPILQMQGGQQFNTDTGQVINPGGQTFNVNTGEGMTKYGKTDNSTFDTTGGTPGASTTPGINTTPLPLSPEQRATNLLKDYQTPMTVEDIRAREREAKEARAREANAIFNPIIEEVKATGEKQVGSSTAQLGVTAGMGASTAKLQFLNAVQVDIDKRVNEVQKRKEEFISNGNFQAAQLAQQSIEKMQEAANNLVLKKAELTLNFMQEDRASAAQEISNKVNLSNADVNVLEALNKIPEGQSIVVNGVTYTGVKKVDVEPFFNSNNIVSLMKEIPAGKTKTITDPITGKVYTLQGLAQVDANLKQFTSTDNAGNVTIINFDPRANNGKGGIVGQVEAKGVGKTGGSGTNVSLTVPNYSNVPAYQNGKQVGILRPNSKGGFEKVDMQGNVVPSFPADVQYGTFSGGNPQKDTGKTIELKSAAGSITIK